MFNLANLSHDLHKEVLLGPATVASATSAYKPVQDCKRFLVRLAYGASDGVFDLRVVQATDSSGTDSKNITGAAITQLAADDDNKQAEIEVDVDALDEGFTHVAVTVTAAGTTIAFVELIKLMNKKPVTQPAALVETVLVTG